MISKEDYVTSKAGILLRYNGSFNLDKLYKKAKNWFNDFSYFFSEKQYKEKTKPEGNEIEIDFVGERKINDYIKFIIEVKLFITEVRKLSKDTYVGNFKANIVSKLDLDYDNKFQYNPFKKFLFFVYTNLIIKNKIEGVYEDKLYSEVLNFEDVLKEHLGLIWHKYIL